MKLQSFAISAVILVLAGSAFGQKKVLDSSVYDSWKSLQGAKLSNDGAWLSYRIAPQEGDAVGHLKALPSGNDIVVERASLTFSNDSKYAVGLIVPKDEDLKKAKREKKKPEDMPKNSLMIVDLASGEKTEIKEVSSFQVPGEDMGWFIYKPEPPKPAAKSDDKKADEKKSEEKKSEEKKQEDKKDEPKKKSDHKPGDTYVLRNFSSGKEEKLENVASFRFSKDGTVLVYAVSTKDGKGDGIIYYDLKSGKKASVVEGMAKYLKLTIDDDTKRVAFVTDKDDYASKTPVLSLYAYDPKGGKLRQLAKKGTPGLEKDWLVSERGGLSFSDKADRLIFATSPEKPEEKKDDTPEDEKVSVDIWNWQDETLQPQQLLRASAEANRTFDAVAFWDSGKVTQLETEDRPAVTILNKGESDWAIARVDKPYMKAQSWGVNNADYYLIDVRNGSAKKFAEKTEDIIQASPTGRYLQGYDQVKREIYAIDIASGKRVSLSAKIPYPIWDELNDVPDYPSAYGGAGWTKDDKLVLIYDDYDIWAVDPTGKADPICVTDGYGRRSKNHLRYFSVDPEEKFVDLAKPIYLRSLNEDTKAGGIYVDDLKSSPKSLISGNKQYNFVGQAKNGGRVIYTQQDFVEYPDVWACDDLKFQGGVKVTNTNPQQKDYWWGTAELVDFTSNDGIPLKGIIVKPENFDRTKKYPMIAYFYERNSDTLNQYRTPAPSASIINPSVFASNGYVVFIPDIPYKIGYPGESAISAIVPGCQEVIRKGYVDPKRVGIQGQSWGGYQVAYMVTETNMFAAACAGAPVSDMFSAYGGIRWGSGMVRQFQYEKTQSRIGGTPWNSTLRYIENSPVFFADKVETPLLIMHNDKDGAVPWWQSIEYFTALRRLEKPAWMCVYNGEDHNLVQRKNRKDWTIRMQQFFDHFLKGEPMPVWMDKGVPATMKGKTYGFEIPDKKKGS
ncbi:MAG: hypothetical protein BGO01_09790 [Armatimonadetes bacterium 55-13]|nr:MAG: hypothetical protein BGO01_09790 [Armatimonadetes bacterium 55-13]